MLPERRPAFDTADAERVARELYGIAGTATSLPSDRDQNFKVQLASGEAFVLKFFHADETLAFVTAQRRVFEALEAVPRRVFPRLVPTLSGDAHAWTAGERGVRHLTWLTPFMPGRVAAELRAASAELLDDLGGILALMDGVLAANPQPAARREFTWAAQSAPLVIASNLPHVPASRRPLVEGALATFEAHAGPLLPQLPVSLIHNDVNDYNLLVAGERVSAILDFGDMLESYTVCEVAHAACYLMLDKEDPLAVAVELTRGYQRLRPLSPLELGVIYDFVLLRLALSVTLSAKRQQAEPLDPYLSVSEAPAYRLLERLTAGRPTREDFVDALTGLSAGTVKP